RWNGAKMVMRWVGSGLIQAENQFRRVKGYKAIPALVSALTQDALQDHKDAV
ncbi:MAG: IS256 family transposase, partial [bacterium]|nr:IS256 family transposase [bacterium]